MKKRYVVPLVGVAAAAGVTYLMRNRKNEGSLDSVKTVEDSFVQAGLPDQVDRLDDAQLENAKMVSEGSQFGVQYFTEAAEGKVEELSEEVSK